MRHTGRLGTVAGHDAVGPCGNRSSCGTPCRAAPGPMVERRVVAPVPTFRHGPLRPAVPARGDARPRGPGTAMTTPFGATALPLMGDVDHQATAGAGAGEGEHAERQTSPHARDEVRVQPVAASVHEIPEGPVPPGCELARRHDVIAGA